MCKKTIFCLECRLPFKELKNINKFTSIPCTYKNCVKISRLKYKRFYLIYLNILNLWFKTQNSVPGYYLKYLKPGQFITFFLLV